MTQSPTFSSLETRMIDLITRDVVRVPPFPAVAMRVLEVVRSTSYTVGRLARLVAEDPTLTATVLRQCSSAAMRGAYPVTSLEAAIRRVGSEDLTRLVIATSVGKMATVDGPLSELRRIVWRRSVTSAMICKLLSTKRGHDVHEAFVCGLLHDFGWTVAIACAEDALASRLRERSRTIDDWMALLDVHHVPLGELTAARWNLSPLLKAAMACHHEPAKSPLSDPKSIAILETVIFSDAVVKLLEDVPMVSPADLAQLPGAVDAQEVEHIAQHLPLVLEAVDEMSALLPPPMSTRPGHSLIVKPEAPLPELGTVRLRATWCRSSGDVPLEIEAMQGSEVTLITHTRPTEGYLMKLLVDVHGESRILFVTTQRVRSAVTGFVVDARLLGASAAMVHEIADLLGMAERPSGPAPSRPVANSGLR